MLRPLLFLSWRKLYDIDLRLWFSTHQFEYGPAENVLRIPILHFPRRFLPSGHDIDVRCHRLFLSLWLQFSHGRIRGGLLGLSSLDMIDFAE